MSYTRWLAEPKLHRTAGYDAAAFAHEIVASEGWRNAVDMLHLPQGTHSLAPRPGTLVRLTFQMDRSHHERAPHVSSGRNREEVLVRSMMDENQSRSGASSEAADVKRVNTALRALQAGDIATAEKILMDVAARIPREYTFQFEKDGWLFIKLWSKEEFVNFVQWQQQQGISKSVNWIGSAYPRACYYLGFLNVKSGNFSRAIEWLDRGMALEPGHPRFRLEKAQVLVRLKRHEEALALYESVMEPGPYISPHEVALALRGAGLVRAELGSLDLAEASFRKSLEIEPGNEIALNELDHINNLRKTGVASPPGVVAAKGSDATQCAICGQKSKEGRLIDIYSRLTFVCARCLRERTKRWWQFWK